MSEQPPGVSHFLPSLFIAAFLATQILLPLRPHLPGADRYDERFAWAMFSPRSEVACVGGFVVDGTPVDMASAFHRIWLVRFSKGVQGSLTREMAAHLCTANRGRDIRLQRTCREVNGEEVLLDDGLENLCAEAVPW
jgi:hypothetical protein